MIRPEADDRVVAVESGTRGERSSAVDRGTLDDLLGGDHPLDLIGATGHAAELVFDQGLGDLFVIRVAGNIIAPSLVGSVEFAADQFGTRLVVVLGHTMCGAIKATVEELERPSEQRSPNLKAIVDRIRPSVENLMETELRADRDALIRQAVRANVRVSAGHLRHGSQILEDLITDDGLLVVGAEYSLETGEIDFFDGVP